MTAKEEPWLVPQAEEQYDGVPEVAKVRVTMSDKGPGDKDVRGDGTGWILSTGAAGMDITPGKIRYPGAYRADDMHVPYHRRTTCKWLYCARAISPCPLTAISCGYRECTSAAVWELQVCRNKPPVWTYHRGQLRGHQLC